MLEQPKLDGDDWLAVVHAPYRVYAIVASADAPASGAQFRTLMDELHGAREAFRTGTIGAAVIDALVSNDEKQWALFQESTWSLEDGLKRARKALKNVPGDESDAFRDWLMAFATRIAGSRRVVGSEPISPGETEGLELVAKRLDRPVPEPPAAPAGDE